MRLRALTQTASLPQRGIRRQDFSCGKTEHRNRTFGWNMSGWTQFRFCLKMPLHFLYRCSFPSFVLPTVKSVPKNSWLECILYPRQARKELLLRKSTEEFKLNLAIIFKFHVTSDPSFTWRGEEDGAGAVAGEDGEAGAVAVEPPRAGAHVPLFSWELLFFFLKRSWRSCACKDALPCRRGPQHGRFPSQGVWLTSEGGTWWGRNSTGGW